MMHQLKAGITLFATNSKLSHPIAGSTLLLAGVELLRPYSARDLHILAV